MAASQMAAGDEIDLVRRQDMRRFDRLPKCLRDAGNATNLAPIVLKGWIKRCGGDPNAAARAIMKQYRASII